MISEIKSLRVTALALPLAFAGSTTSAFAQSTTDTQAMATLICRPALATEHADAKMVQTSTLLVCQPFAVRMRMGDGSMRTIGSVTAKAPAGPDFSAALTPQQTNEAYNRWVQKTFRIDPATEHTP